MTFLDYLLPRQTMEALLAARDRQQPIQVQLDNENYTAFSETGSEHEVVVRINSHPIQLIVLEKCLNWAYVSAKASATLAVLEVDGHKAHLRLPEHGREAYGCLSEVSDICPAVRVRVGWELMTDEEVFATASFREAFEQIRLRCGRLEGHMKDQYCRTILRLFWKPRFWHVWSLPFPEDPQVRLAYVSYACAFAAEQLGASAREIVREAWDRAFPEQESAAKTMRARFNEYFDTEDRTTGFHPLCEERPSSRVFSYTRMQSLLDRASALRKNVSKPLGERRIEANQLVLRLEDAEAHFEDCLQRENEGERIVIFERAQRMACDGIWYQKLCFEYQCKKEESVRVQVPEERHLRESWSTDCKSYKIVVPCAKVHVERRSNRGEIKDTSAVDKLWAGGSVELTGAWMSSLDVRIRIYTTLSDMYVWQEGKRKMKDTEEYRRVMKKELQLLAQNEAEFELSRPSAAIFCTTLPVDEDDKVTLASLFEAVRQRFRCRKVSLPFKETNLEEKQRLLIEDTRYWTGIQVVLGEPMDMECKCCNPDGDTFRKVLHVSEDNAVALAPLFEAVRQHFGYSNACLCDAKGNHFAEEQRLSATDSGVVIATEERPLLQMDVLVRNDTRVEFKIMNDSEINMQGVAVIWHADGDQGTAGIGALLAGQSMVVRKVMVPDHAVFMIHAELQSGLQLCIGSEDFQLGEQEVISCFAARSVADRKVVG